MSEHMGTYVWTLSTFSAGEGEGKEETEQHFHKTFGRMDRIIQTVAQLINQYSFFAGEMKVDKLAHLSIHFEKKMQSAFMEKNSNHVWVFFSSRIHSKNFWQ